MRRAAAIFGFALSACATLPAELDGRAVIVGRADPYFARAQDREAVSAPGGGGISESVVVRITGDVPAWRIWSDPKKRIGRWWSLRAPSGTREVYRREYAICTDWNALTHVTRCTLKRGAIVAIGPGNSVSTCRDPDETYPANPRDWQLFVADPGMLDCPAPSADYELDPSDISRARR